MSPNNSSEEEKIRLEHQAAKIFMRRYEQLSEKKMRHIWHNRPRKPDVSCRLENERLDIEISHLYGSQEDARKILGRDISQSTLETLIEQSTEQDTHARLLKALNKILEKKAGKAYNSKRVWLVIRNAHPAWNDEALRSLKHCIEVPSCHPFEEIWMVTDMSSRADILKLYPEN